MSDFLQLILALVIIILAAKLGGYLSLRLGQPSVLGELLAGLLLGPTVINLFELPFFTDEHLPTVVAHLAEIGVLLLMFVAGLELHLDELVKSTKVAGLAGSLGVIVPIVLGAGVALLFNFEPEVAIFIGLVLSATSVSISAQTLIELDVLRSRVGLALLGAAVFDDMLVILFLSIFVALSLSASQGLTEVVWVVVRMVGFLVLAVIVGAKLLVPMARLADRLPVSQGLIAFAIIAGLFFAWSAEVVGGMAAITGAFLAGLFLAGSPLKEYIAEGMSTLAYGFFVPIFFAGIGLAVNLRDLGASGLGFTLAIIVVAVLGKIVGSGLGARLAGFNLRESLQLGIGMVSRGEVGLIVASVGVLQGLLDQATFSIIVVMVIVTTLVTPPMLRAAFAGSARIPAAQSLNEGRQ